MQNICVYRKLTVSLKNNNTNKLSPRYHGQSKSMSIQVITSKTLQQTARKMFLMSNIESDGINNSYLLHGCTRVALETVVCEASRLNCESYDLRYCHKVSNNPETSVGSLLNWYAENIQGEPIDITQLLKNIESLLYNIDLDSIAKTRELKSNERKTYNFLKALEHELLQTIVHNSELYKKAEWNQ